MFDYLTSDLHLGHKNIIEYCDRPYNSKEEMDSKLISNWNEKVSPNESVLYIGDLTLSSVEDALSYLDELNGTITFIQGNHDRLKMKDTSSSVHIFDSLVFTYKGIKFHVVHQPYNYSKTIPNQWLLHGHTHNNEIDEYPFFNPYNQSVNLSVELTNYKPVSFDRILSLIQNKNSIIESKG